MRRVAEAPPECYIRDLVLAQMWVRQVSAASLQSSFTDPLRDCAAFRGKQPVQVAHGNARSGAGSCKWVSMKYSTRGRSCAQRTILVAADSGRAMQPARMSR